MKDRFCKCKDVDQSLMPMMEYFNALNDEKFLIALDYITKGWGFGLKNNYSCSLVDNGVKFINANGEEGKCVIIDHKEFFNILNTVCEDYLTDNKNDIDKIKSFIIRYEDSFL